MVVDWLAVLKQSDIEGLITPSNQDAAVHLCQVADARLRAEFPLAYKVLTNGKNDLVWHDLVTRAVFRVVRNEASGGMQHEADGVYQYTFSALTQSPDIWWTNSDKDLLASLSPSPFAMGPLHRGGLTG